MKRRVQGGRVTSERRRRDRVYQKSFKRIFSPFFSHRRRHRGDRAAVFLAVDGTLTLIRRGDQWSPAMIHKDTSLLSYFSLTKRRVQGGVATSERRRRDGVSGKSHIRGVPPLIYLPLSPRGDQCEQSALTVPL